MAEIGESFNTWVAPGRMLSVGLGSFLRAFSLMGVADHGRRQFYLDSQRFRTVSTFPI
jgi:hypothetical protein